MTLVIILFNVFTPQGLIISKKNRLPEGRLKQERKTVGRKGVGERSEEKKEGRKRRKEEGEREGGVSGTGIMRARGGRVYIGKIQYFSASYEISSPDLHYYFPF